MLRAGAGAIPTGRAPRKWTDAIPVAVTSAERLGARKSESVRDAPAPRRSRSNRMHSCVSGVWPCHGSQVTDAWNIEPPSRAPLPHHERRTFRDSDAFRS